MSVLRIGHLNPILNRELRQRSRSIRMPVILGVFLLLVLGTFVITYEGVRQSDQFLFGAEALAASARAGRVTFEVTAMAMLGLILLIIPATSATAINAERDRQTLVPLQVTLLRPSSIFWGKVMSASSFVLLLVIACMPIMTISFVLGGISLGDVVGTLTMLSFLGVVTATIGVSLSSIFSRGPVSNLVTYLLIASLVIGSLIMVGVIAIFDNARGTAEWRPLYFNPFVALASVAGRRDPGAFIDAPLSSIHQTMMNDEPWNAASSKGFPPLLLRTTLPLIGLSLSLAWLGIRGLQTPKSKLD